MAYDQVRRNRIPPPRKAAAVIKFVAVVFVIVGIAIQLMRGNAAGAWTESSGTILPARLRPGRVIAVTRSFPATVVSVAVSPGTEVHRGQVLAMLESQELSAAEVRAASHLARARERVEGLTRAASVDNSRVNLEPVSVDSYQQTVDNLRAKLQHMQELRDRQLATASEVDDARTALTNAQQSLQGALEHRSQVQQNQVQWDTAQMHAKSEREDARLEMEEATAEVQAAADHKKELKVVAEWSGTVVAAPVAPGEMLFAGSPLLQIADLSRLSVEVSAGAKIARAVHPGDEVAVRLPIDPPREIKAKIADVQLAPDGASYILRIFIPNPDPNSVLAGLEGAVVFPHVSSALNLWTKLPF